jgi:nickel/cobalt exporter
VVGRTRRYPLARVARLSGLAGVAHVLVSIVLGGVIIVVGLQFRSAVQSAQDTIIGCLLMATGLGFAVFELSGRGHPEHSHHHGPDGPHTPGRTQATDHPRSQPIAQTEPASVAPQSGLRGLAAVMVPFGAAASPDLTILPVFLAATTAGVTTAIGSLVGLTLAACFGGYQVRGRWLERWGNACTALVLIVIGALVLTGVL